MQHITYVVLEETLITKKNKVVFFFFYFHTLVADSLEQNHENGIAQHGWILNFKLKQVPHLFKAGGLGAA